MRKTLIISFWIFAAFIILPDFKGCAMRMSEKMAEKMEEWNSSGVNYTPPPPPPGHIRKKLIPGDEPVMVDVRGRPFKIFVVANGDTPGRIIEVATSEAGLIQNPFTEKIDSFAIVEMLPGQEEIKLPRRTEELHLKVPLTFVSKKPGSTAIECESATVVVKFYD